MIICLLKIRKNMAVYKQLYCRTVINILGGKMEKIIQKRTELINFFLNENNTYTKGDILNKEFAVLSFSPHDELIDTITTPYDHLCINPSTFNFDEDINEFYVKGIITDVDRQQYQTIIHIQNKDKNISITIRDRLIDIYNDYYIVGDPVIAKCRTWNGRIYLSFMVNLNYLEHFTKEQRYMSGVSFNTVANSYDVNKRFQYGVIITVMKVRTKTDKLMLRGWLFDGERKREFGAMDNGYNNDVPWGVQAGDYVRFSKPKHDFFINNMEVVNL